MTKILFKDRMLCRAKASGLLCPSILVRSTGLQTIDVRAYCFLWSLWDRGGRSVKRSIKKGLPNGRPAKILSNSWELEVELEAEANIAASLIAIGQAIGVLSS